MDAVSARTLDQWAEASKPISHARVLVRTWEQRWHVADAIVVKLIRAVVRVNLHGVELPHRRRIQELREAATRGPDKNLNDMYWMKQVVGEMLSRALTSEVAAPVGTHIRIKLPKASDSRGPDGPSWNRPPSVQVTRKSDNALLVFSE